MAKKISINTEVNRLEENNLQYTIGELSLFASENSSDFLSCSDVENLISMSETLGKIKGAISIIDNVIARISPNIPRGPNNPNLNSAGLSNPASNMYGSLPGIRPIRKTAEDKVTEAHSKTLLNTDNVQEKGEPLDDSVVITYEKSDANNEDLPVTDSELSA